MEDVKFKKRLIDYRKDLKEGDLIAHVSKYVPPSFLIYLGHEKIFPFASFKAMSKGKVSVISWSEIEKHQYDWYYLE